jgi:hypothetical protein
MKCYLYDENRKFVSEYTAQESPLEPGVFIIPESSTDIAPPEILADELLLWTGSQWQVNKIPAPEPVLEPTIEDLRSTMVLTPAQARIKLAGLGLLDGIETTIVALPITDVVSIYWYYATEFRRDDAILTAFCTDKLGMTAEQIDGLFS